MPAGSKSQQRLMGMVHAEQKGELKHPSKKVKEMANTMKAKDVTDFASTKQTGLPDKKASLAKVATLMTNYRLMKMAGLLKNKVVKTAGERTVDNYETAAFRRALVKAGFGPYTENALLGAVPGAALGGLVGMQAGPVGGIIGAGAGGLGGAVLAALKTRLNANNVRAGIEDSQGPQKKKRVVEEKEASVNTITRPKAPTATPIKGNQGAVVSGVVSNAKSTAAPATTNVPKMTHSASVAKKASLLTNYILLKTANAL